MIKNKYVLLMFFGLLGCYFIVNDFSFFYLLFATVTSVLLSFLFVKKVSIFLKFSVCLFILGNWLKVTLHGIFDYPYIEATGNFTGSESQWVDYFIFSTTIAFALIVGIILYISAAGVKTSIIAWGSQLGYRKFKFKFTPQILLFLIIIIYALNWMFGFYRIGVARDLKLPFGLDAPASFVVYMFAPMLFAIWAHHKVLKDGLVTNVLLIITATIFIIASVVTYSRAIIVVFMIPAILGMYKTSDRINGGSQSLAGLFAIIFPSIIIAILLVSIVRIFVYGGASVVDSTALQFYFIESLGLVFDRWIGAEGLMTAVASQPSIDLFFRMFFEDPTVGANGLYQHLAGSNYYLMTQENMTFLTLPGAYALLAFSGNLFIVFIGVLVTIAIGILIEQLVINNFPRQYPLQYVISAAVAYHFSQMIFTALLIPFIVQLIFFLMILKIVYKFVLTHQIRS